MKIVILGGSFDPPHFGHLLVAQQVLDFTPSREVWLMPCFSHPFAKKMTSAHHRFAMAKLCSNKKIKVSDWEVKQKKTSYTINTLKALSKKFPQHQFSWIIGSEQVKDFKKWKDWQEILKNFTVWVFPRTSLNDKELLPGMRQVKDEFLITSDLSSTKIRKRAKKGLSIDFFVPGKVACYIKNNMIYR